MIQCDGGGEFKPVQKLSIESGIQFRMSCPYTSQQNGRAERKHRHVAELGLTLLAQAKMPLSYWWEAFSTVVYLINRLPSSVNTNESPYSLLFKKDPDYTALKPFGCACYPCLKPYNQHKLQFHTTRCVFLGYSSSHKGYKCVNSHGRIFVSRHVVFNENHFPFQEGFLDTRNPIKTATNEISTGLPFYPAGVTTNNTTEETSNIVDHEEQELDDSNTITDQLVLGGSFENTHENNLRESDSETKDSPEAVGTPENNSPLDENKRQGRNIQA